MGIGRLMRLQPFAFLIGIVLTAVQVLLIVSQSSYLYTFSSCISIFRCRTIYWHKETRPIFPLQVRY
jgi:hypothetical protein